MLVIIIIQVVAAQFCRYDPSIDTKLLIPDDCWSFWDGCNKCVYPNYNMPLCTMNVCTYDQMTCPYCIEDDALSRELVPRNIP